MATQSTSFVATNTPVDGKTVVTSSSVSSDLLALIADYNLLIGSNKINATAVGTSALASSAVTTAKLKPSTFFVAGGTGGDFTTASASFTNVTGASTTYTTGTTAERVIVFGNCSIYNTLGAGNSTYVIMSFSGAGLTTQYAPRSIVNSGSRFSTTVMGIVDAPASTTITIQFQMRVASGTGTFEINAADQTWGIMGIAVGNA